MDPEPLGRAGADAVFDEGIDAADAGLYDCIGPIDALVEAGAGRPFDNNSPAELGARTVEILEAAYRSSTSGAAERVKSLA